MKITDLVKSDLPKLQVPELQNIAQKRDEEDQLGYHELSRLIELDEVIRGIRDNCKPFLSQTDDEEKNILFRGLNKDVPDMAGQAIVDHNRRSNRKPKGQNQRAHNFLNQVFVKMFGKPYRNGLFTTGNINRAFFFGHPIAIYPIGDFSFIWSLDVVDMWDLKPITDNIDNTISLEKAIKNKKYINNELTEAIQSGHEIMLWCDRYYWISASNLTRYSDLSIGIIAVDKIIRQ